MGQSRGELSVQRKRSRKHVTQWWDGEKQTRMRTVVRVGQKIGKVCTGLKKVCTGSDHGNWLVGS